MTKCTFVKKQIHDRFLLSDRETVSVQQNHNRQDLIL